jgi:hypothetical protein
VAEGFGAGVARGDGGSLVVELLYEEDAGFDRDGLLAEVNEVLPQTVLAGDGVEPLLLAHHGYETTFAEGAPVPVMSAVLRYHLRDRSGIDLSQTRVFPQARAVLDRCHAAISVAEMFGGPCPPGDRLHVFRATVLAVCRLTTPLAAWWPAAAQLLLPPAAGSPPLLGLVNVRLFRVDGSIVMDTLGLQVFGLPDIQCHCHGLEVPRLAAHLRNLASYVFEHGDVVSDGDTIEGLEPGQRWRCQHERALVPPGRPVVDLNPGAAHAAGRRSGWR